MSIYYWRYTLRSREGLNRRSGRRKHHGALIRTDAGGVGCLHPWPELGDRPIDDQLGLLARGARSPLIDAALRCAALDGAARAAHRSLFEGLTIPPSHQTLMAGGAPDPGFDLIKVKGGELPARAPHQRIRVDFNGTLDRPTFERWAAALPDPASIDFVEDPFPYDRDEWLACQESTGLALAVDRAGFAEKRYWPGTVVIKPAIESVPDPAGRRLVITSYMDHPVGQIFAAFEAARLAAGEGGTHGLLTHSLFDPNPFSEQLCQTGNRILPPAGTGLGFDALLEGIPWQLC